MSRVGYVLVLWVLLMAMAPMADAGAARPQVVSEETVLTEKGGAVRIFDQVALSAKADLVWPLTLGATDLKVQGARILGRSGTSVRLAPSSTAFVLTYAVPLQGSSYIWSRDVSDPPGEWVVLVGPGIRPGFVEGLPFKETGTVTIAGESLIEFTADRLAGPTSFAWPFLTSPWPGIVSKALWGLVAALLLAAAWLAWVRAGGRRSQGVSSPSQDA